MPKLRSATSTQGRNMAGARALWRATGMRTVLMRWCVFPTVTKSLREC